MELTINRTKVVLEKGDITHQRTDASVNAANGTLLGGGGVDGANHRAEGKELLDASKRSREDDLGGEKIQTGEAVIRQGYQLAGSNVTHTVGPVWGEDKSDKEQLLKNCYETSL